MGLLWSATSHRNPARAHVQLHLDPPWPQSTTPVSAFFLVTLSLSRTMWESITVLPFQASAELLIKGCFPVKRLALLHTNQGVVWVLASNSMLLLTHVFLRPQYLPATQTMARNITFPPRGPGSYSAGSPTTRSLVDINKASLPRLGHLNVSLKSETMALTQSS